MQYMLWKLSHFWHPWKWYYKILASLLSVKNILTSKKVKEWLRLKQCMYNSLQEVTQREDELGREHGSYLHLTLYPRKKQSSRYVFIWCGTWITYKKRRKIYFFFEVLVLEYPWFVFYLWLIWKRLLYHYSLWFLLTWLWIVENFERYLGFLLYSISDLSFSYIFWLKEENPLMCIGHTSASEDDSRNFKPHYETWFDSVQERSRFFLLNMKNVISVNNFQGIHTYKL